MIKKILTILSSTIIICGNVSFASYFPDVPEDSQAINWLYEQGVINGYEDGTFKSDKPVNRAEFLKMLYEILGMNGYEDLRTEMGKILKEKFPEYFIHGDVAIFTNFSGFNIFNKQYDAGKTLRPHLYNWARDLEVGTFLGKPRT